MRALFLLALAVAVPVGCGPKKVAPETQEAVTLPTPDALIARAIAQSGGEAALRAHQSVVFEGQMRMQAQGIVAEMRLMQKAPAELYSRVELPGVGVMEEGVERGVAWARDPLSGPRIKEGVERAQALRSADPSYLLNLHQHFPVMETKGRGELEGRAVWELRMVPAEGAEELGYFDVETGDWTGSRVTVETAMGKILITTLNGDYRVVDGVRIPHHLRVVNALMSTEILWTSVTFDPPDLVFPPMPDDVRALISAGAGG